MQTPKATVLMTVYNGEQHIKDAVESILNQTYRNFEFLIIDNKSTDSTVSIIKQYKDSLLKCGIKVEHFILYGSFAQRMEQFWQ